MAYYYYYIVPDGSDNTLRIVAYNLILFRSTHYYVPTQADAFVGCDLLLNSKTV